MRRYASVCLPVRVGLVDYVALGTIYLSVLYLPSHKMLGVVSRTGSAWSDILVHDGGKTSVHM